MKAVELINDLDSLVSRPPKSQGIEKLNDVKLAPDFDILNNNDYMDSVVVAYACTGSIFVSTPVLDTKGETFVQASPNKRQFDFVQRSLVI